MDFRHFGLLKFPILSISGFEDFGLCILRVLNFKFCGCWILKIWGIWDSGFREFWFMGDSGDIGSSRFRILGILDFKDFEFQIFSFRI